MAIGKIAGAGGNGLVDINGGPVTGLHSSEVLQ